MAENRFAKYAPAQPGFVPLPPKAPTGFAPPGAAPVAAIPGGEKDPNYIRQVKGIETGIDTAGQIAAARVKAALDAQNQARLQQQKAAIDAAQAARNRQANVNTLTPEMAGDLKTRLAAMGELQKRLNEMKGMYAKNFQGQPASRGFGLTEMLPEFMSPTVQDFNQKGRRMGPIITSVLGLGSKNTDAATEYQQKVVPFIPQASNFDGTTEDKFRDIQSMINTQNALVRKQLGLPPLRAAKPDPKQAPAKVVNFHELPE